MINTQDGGLLQSEEWSKFKAETGLKTFLLRTKDSFVASILKYNLPFGLKYFFIPRGPLLSVNNDTVAKLGELVELAKQEGVSWIRVEPQSQDDLEFLRKNINYKIVKTAKDIQPPQTLILNLEKSEEDLLSQMKTRTRYNVNLSFRKEIEFQLTDNEKDIEGFLNITQATGQRNHISVYPNEYYLTLFKTIPENILIYVAKKDSKVIAATIVFQKGDFAVELYGASDYDYRSLKAPYGLRYFIMKDLKSKGVKSFDLGGSKIIKTAEGKSVPAPGSWFGFSQIKLGFCPKCEPVNFPGTWDIILVEYKYWFYRFIQKARELTRWVLK